MSWFYWYGHSKNNTRDTHITAQSDFPNSILHFIHQRNAHSFLLAVKQVKRQTNGLLNKPLQVVIRNYKGRSSNNIRFSKLRKMVYSVSARDTLWVVATASRPTWPQSQGGSERVVPVPTRCHPLHYRGSLLAAFSTRNDPWPDLARQKDKPGEKVFDFLVKRGPWASTALPPPFCLEHGCDDQSHSGHLTWETLRWAQAPPSCQLGATHCYTAAWR